jgi:hypothetical protein
LGAVVLDPSHKNTAIFDLIGISNHSGGLGAGHYTAKARNNDVGWCEFNDSYAAKLDHGLPDTFNSREAYLLFYQRRDPPPANPQRKTRSSTSNLLSLSTPATKNNFSGEGTSSQISPSRRRNESHSGYPKRMDID